MQRVFGTGGELAVRERAGAAQAELDVAFRVEAGGCVEALDIRRATGRVAAAFDQEWLQAGLRQGERREEAGASSTDDDGAKRGAQGLGYGCGERRFGGVDDADTTLSCGIRL